MVLGALEEEVKRLCVWRRDTQLQSYKCLNSTQSHEAPTRSARSSWSLLVIKPTNSTICSETKRSLSCMSEEDSSDAFGVFGSWQTLHQSRPRVVSSFVSNRSNQRLSTPDSRDLQARIWPAFSNYSIQRWLCLFQSSHSFIGLCVDSFRTS